MALSLTIRRIMQNNIPIAAVGSKFAASQRLSRTTERQASSSSRPRSCDPPTDRLDKIVKLSLLRNEDEEKVKKIWKEYHINKDLVFGTIESDSWKTIVENYRKYPMFLYPLPRAGENNTDANGDTHQQGGLEMFLGQFRGTDCFFTSLLAYKTYAELAPVYMTVNHYNELVDEKKLVLMRAEFDKKHLNVIEAQCLVNQLYLNYKRSNNQLLHTFNVEPSKFDYQAVIRQVQSLGAE